MILLLIRPLKSAHTCGVRRVVCSCRFEWDLGDCPPCSGNIWQYSRAQQAKHCRSSCQDWATSSQVTASLSRSWLLKHNSQGLPIGLVQLTEPLARKEITRIRTGDTGTRSTRERSFCDRREAVETTRNVGSPHVM